METPSDEQVKAYIDSVPGLRAEWGIPGAKRAATLSFVVMIVCLIAIFIGTIAYLMFGDPSLASINFSGLIIVVVLTYVVNAVRIFQLRAERAEIPAYRKALANKLTGNPETDVQAQEVVDANFKWESLRYRTIARMIGIAGLVIITINTYQSGVIDVSRTLIFDAAIVSYLAGAFWNNFAFKTDLLEVELMERSRATIKWQKEHPGEAQRLETSSAPDDTASPALQVEDTQSDDDPVDDN